MSSNQTVAQVLARVDQVSALLKDLKERAAAADTTARMIDKQVKQPLRVDLPVAKGPATAAGAPAEVIVASLADLVRDKARVAEEVEQVQAKVTRRINKMERELAEALGQEDFSLRAIADVEQASWVAEAVLAQGEARQGRDLDSPSDIVQDTPEPFQQERAEFAAKVQRVAELEAALKRLEAELVEARNEAEERAESEGRYKQKVEAWAREARTLKQEREDAAAERAQMAERLDTLQEAVEGLEQSLQNSRAAEQRLRAEYQTQAGVCSRTRERMVQLEQTLESRDREIAQLKALRAESEQAHSRALARLKHEAEQRDQTRQAEIARLKQQASEQDKLREVEIAGLKKKVAQTDEARWSDIARHKNLARQMDAAHAAEMKRQADQKEAAHRAELARLRQQADQRAVADQAEIKRLKDLVVDLDRRFFALRVVTNHQTSMRHAESKRLSRELRGRDHEICELSARLADTAGKAARLAGDLDTRTREAQGLTERLAGRSAELEAEKGRVKELSRDVAAKAAELEAKEAQVQELSQDLAAKAAELEAEKGQVKELSQELAAKAAKLEAEKAQRSDLSSQAEELSRSLGARAAELEAEKARAEELSRDIEAKADDLDAEKARVSELSQTLGAKAAELAAEKARAEELSRERDARTAELAVERARADELSGRLVASAAELEAKERGMDELSSALEERTAEREAERARAAELSRALDVKAADVARLSRQIQDAAKLVHLRADDLLHKSEQADQLAADLRELRDTVVAICTALTGTTLRQDEWLEICRAVTALTDVPRTKAATTPWWAVGQSVCGPTCELQVRGVPLLCLHLAVRLRAGPWDNQALALAASLAQELDVSGPLSVPGLRLVLSAAASGAREHASSILLLSIWQLAVRLDETCADELGFGDLRRALEDELRHAPWCEKVARAISAGTVRELCASEGQLLADESVGVLYGPRPDQFVAFDLQGRRLWEFGDVHVRVDFLTVFIPGIEQGLDCDRNWWSGVYEQ